MQDAIDAGERDVAHLKILFTQSIQTCIHFKIDYISIACSQTLREVEDVTSGTLISAAVYFKEVRLIDNFLYQSST